MSGWLNGWCRRPDPDAAPIDLICMAGDARLLDSVDFVPGALFSRLLLPFCCAPFTGAPCARSISPTALVLTDWMLHVAAANQHLRLLGPSIEQSAASAEGHGRHFCCRPIGLTTFINGPLTRFIRRRMALHNRCSWPSDGLHLRPTTAAPRQQHQRRRRKSGDAAVDRSRRIELSAQKAANSAKSSGGIDASAWPPSGRFLAFDTGADPQWEQVTDWSRRTSPK